MKDLVDRDRFVRWLPFASVAVLGQASAAWPPGPQDFVLFWSSTALLVVFIAVLVLPRGPTPEAWLFPAGIYITSVALLMLATGGVDSGVGSLLFVPVVGLALYGRRWQSGVAVGAVMGAIVGVALAGPHLGAATARRGLLFGAIAGMLSVSIHTLRDRLLESNRQTTRLLRQAEAISAAARRLTFLLAPQDIAALGAELSVLVASPSDSKAICALYMRVDGSAAVIEAQFGATDDVVGERLELGALSSLDRAARTANAVIGPLETERLQAPLRSAIAIGGDGPTHAAWIPVCPEDSLRGVLLIASPVESLIEDCRERLVALGHLLELALSNWNAHQELEMQATAEERRRIARELHDGLAHELAFIASKTRKSGSSTPVDVREVAGAADRALDEARRAITVLSSSEPQSVKHAVAQTAEDLGSRLGVVVSLDLADGVDFPGEVTENLLRIVREALTNAANHGACSTITVSLVDDDGVRLVVEDDGRGFDTNGCSGSSGFGLLSMKERAASVGATFRVDSSPDHGTRVEVAFK